MKKNMMKSSMQSAADMSKKGFRHLGKAPVSGDSEKGEKKESKKEEKRESKKVEKQEESME